MGSAYYAFYRNFSGPLQIELDEFARNTVREFRRRHRITAALEVALRHSYRYGCAAMPLPGDANDALARELLLDRVTGLPSRVLLHDRLQVAMVRRRRPRSDSLALIWIAVAGIDEVGRRRGDEVRATALRSVATRLSEIVRVADTVARVEGDQFVVLCDELGAESEAVEIAGRVVDGFARSLHFDGENQTMVASVGVAVVAGGEMDPGVVFAQAREAMRRARDRESGDRD